MRNSFYISDIRKHEVEIPDFINLAVKYKLLLSEIKAELQRAILLCSTPNGMYSPTSTLSLFNTLTEVAFDMHSQPTTLEIKQKFLTEHCAKLSLKDKYVCTIERFRLWSRNDITTFQSPEITNTELWSGNDIKTFKSFEITNDEYYDYVRCRNVLKKAIQNEDITKLYSIEGKKVNPKGRPLSLQEDIEKNLIPFIVMKLELIDAHKIEPIAQINLTKEVPENNSSCRVS